MLFVWLTRRPTVLAFALLAALSLIEAAPALANRASGQQGPVSAGLLDGTNRAAFPKWTGVVDRMAGWDSTTAPDCAAAAGEVCGLEHWRTFLSSLRAQSPRGWVGAVQAYINQVRYQPDDDNWQARDYWAAPDEFFTRGGDCEDYAIAKYYSLKLIGFPPQQMRIVVLNDQRLGIAHAVLEVRLGAETYVLDNRFGEAVSWHEVSHYRPIYSVNETNYWVHTGNPKGMTWTLPATAAGATAE